MSLYHEAAEILNTANKSGGSLKSLVFGKKSWKSDPKALFALATETAKWSDILSDVLEKSGVLKVEKTVTPTLALLLVHDLFLSKKGIALPASHGLNSAISRHKVRLSAELTKARLRRGFSTLDDLRKYVDAQATSGQQNGSDGGTFARHPRWIRINTLKTTLDDELNYGTFSNYTQVATLQEIVQAPAEMRAVHVDKHIPNLLAVASPDDPTTFKSYRNGKLILQEKASCFPAYLLDPRPDESKAIDGCAAPGNKTTHLAAILGERSQVIACEKDAERSNTLVKMVKLAGADSIVDVKQKQNFTRLDPNSTECADVTDLLLDPSCSGSGIFGRDEASITVHLPSVVSDEPIPKGKKRKRGNEQKPEAKPQQQDALVEETADEEDVDAAKLKERLRNLSGFQLRIVEHAMSFPAARRITYSTCSVHAEENEHVVVKALLSDIAAERGWKVLKREEQVEGMKKWHKRGNEEAVKSATEISDGELARKRAIDAKTVAEACIRCDKGGEDGTMGFFVVALCRDPEAMSDIHTNGEGVAEEEDDEWSGFSDDET
ncbi:25S rRNA (cytosine-C(5))-methyltransferase rcm1 [Pseudocercospora fuligena]|uniref:25S rRNA (Cytosine-C(5))-methyltransferase rcm1 n=1 Tax=Pseudocercospora fuligena TaxID=685502 RepID=A0A8H6RMP9_9PEZI|nr:25S rRNA (cytosine-C(5))-methyltransferase rcm1 [Pseudocercospora fuligena]